MVITEGTRCDHIKESLFFFLGFPPLQCGGNGLLNNNKMVRKLFRYIEIKILQITMYSCKKVKRYRVSSSLQRSTKVRRFAKGLIFTKSDR